MQVYLEDEDNFLESHDDILKDVYSVIEKCLSEEAAPIDAEISLTIVDKDEIQQINKIYRGIDKITDVLSFPQIEPYANGQIRWEEANKHNVMLGDIVLCHEKAAEQAEAYGHTLKREVCFLVAHSMLHLLGYDHIDETTEKIMFKKQDKILESLNINR